MTQTSFRALKFFAATLLFSVPAFSQRSGASVPMSSARSNAASYYSGHVALEDGSVPKDRVIIESVCSGRVRQETNVDSRGGFGFTLGGSTGDAIMDAGNTATRGGTGAESGNVAECVIRASLPGYLSDIVYLARIERNKPDLGTIVLHKAAPKAPEAPASITSQKAPKEAKKAFDKAADAVKGQKADEAVKQLEKAVQLYPDYAEAWFQLAKLQYAAKQNDAGRKSLEAAAKADEKYIPPAMQLAYLEYSSQNWKALAEITSRILKNAPADAPGSAGPILEVPQSYYLNAIACLRQNDLATGEKALRDGQKADTMHLVPKMWQLMGTVLANKGDFAGAAENFRKYIEYAPMASDVAKTKEVLAEVEKRAAPQPK